MNNSHLLTFVLVALISSLPANAWFRVACATQPLVSERVDPIISPKFNPSNHVHTIHGASNFAYNSTYETLRASSCTSCLVTQDKSDYWFPKLYFQDPSTKLFEAVPNGGLLVYYQNRGDGDVRNGGPGIKAFPPGFKMVTGNPTARSHVYPPGEGSQGELAERAIQWSCLRYSANLPGYDSNGQGFPTTDCEAGFNARLHMPACWDGVNVDSPNHTSHTAYLSRLDNGSCPPTHPVYLMKLFYEVTWDVHSFVVSGRWNPSANAWPFVYANGDPTGYSWHGDFQNGWDTTALQNAIDKCNNPNDQTGNGVTEACSFLTVQQASVAGQCTIPPAVNEPVNGPFARLPGCNPIQVGPGNATLYSASNCPLDATTNVTTSAASSVSPIAGATVAFEATTTKVTSSAGPVVTSSASSDTKSAATASSAPPIVTSGAASNTTSNVELVSPLANSTNPTNTAATFTTMKCAV